MSLLSLAEQWTTSLASFDFVVVLRRESTIWRKRSLSQVFEARLPGLDRVQQLPREAVLHRDLVDQGQLTLEQAQLLRVNEEGRKALVECRDSLGTRPLAAVLCLSVPVSARQAARQASLSGHHVQAWPPPAQQARASASDSCRRASFHGPRRELPARRLRCEDACDQGFVS